MRFDYTAQHKCPITGAPIFEDYECIVIADHTFENGELEISLIDVQVEIAEYVNGDDGKYHRVVTATPSLYDGDIFTKAHASKILEIANGDDRFMSEIADRIMVEEGIIYAGRGGNDPDGHYRRVSL